jgi:hypothetical protein
VLVAAAIGTMLIYRFGGMRDFVPRWAAGLLILGTGTATGFGATSIVYLICRPVVPGFRVLPELVEVILAGYLGFTIYRNRTQVSEPRPSKILHME